MFLATLILLFLVGCGDSPSVEVNDRIAFDINMATSEVFVDGELALRMTFSGNINLSEYDSYIEFVDYRVSDELAYLAYNRGSRYVFLPYTTLYDFQWVDVGITMVQDVLGFIFYQRNVLYSFGDLPAGVPFVVTAMNGSNPQRGISFLDENGERRGFAISLSMAGDEGHGGAFAIVELENF